MTIHRIPLIDVNGVPLNRAERRRVVRRAGLVIPAYSTFVRERGFLRPSPGNYYSMGVGSVTTAMIREKLSAARTYFVRSDGSDAVGVTGLVDASSASAPNCAFLTIGKVLTVAAALDASTFDVTIKLQDNTWAENVTLPKMTGSGTFMLRSTSGTAASCIISPASGSAVGIAGGGNRWWLQDFEVRSAAGANEGIDVDTAGFVIMFNVHYGSVGRHHFQVGAYAQALFAAGYTIRGNCGTGAHMHAHRGGFIQAASIGTVTITGRRSLPSGFVFTESDAQVFAPGITFAGDAVTYTVASPGKVNQAAHGGSNDDPVIFKGTPPAALTAGTIYFKRNVAAGDYEVSATAGGASINFADAGGASTAISIISGVRFNMTGNSQVAVNGAGTSYFPGAAAGTGDPGTFDAYT